MQKACKHFHGWILRISEQGVSFTPIPGEYTDDKKCRRHTTKAAGGDASKVIVLKCRSEETCPSRFEVAAVAS